MGDFNLTKINWLTLSPTLNHTNSDSQLIISSQRSHLLQKVLSPTHHTNITDLLFISIDNILTNVVVDMPFTTSDHNTIHFELLTPNHSSVSSAHSSDINTIPNLILQKPIMLTFLRAFYQQIGIFFFPPLVLLMWPGRISAGTSVRL